MIDQIDDAGQLRQWHHPALSTALLSANAPSTTLRPAISLTALGPDRIDIVMTEASKANPPLYHTTRRIRPAWSERSMNTPDYSSRSSPARHLIAINISGIAAKAVINGPALVLRNAMHASGINQNTLTAAIVSVVLRWLRQQRARC